MEDLIKSLTRPELSDILYVRQCIEYALRHQLHMERFLEIPRNIISPCVDPLAHDFEKSTLNYYDQQVYPVTSMIFHKMAILGANPQIGRIFCTSPNLRKELERKNGRYSTEFTQVDFEWTGSYHDTLDLIKRLIGGLHLVLGMNEKTKEVIQRMSGRELEPVDPTSIQVIDSSEFPDDLSDTKMHEYLKENGRDLGEIPFILTNLKREAYDRWDGEKYLNFDVIYPIYGEVLSGGAREWEYDRLRNRMIDLNYNLDEFEAILELAQKGLTKWTCGAGFGIERLTRAILHLDDVSDCLAFPRVPAQHIAM